MDSKNESSTQPDGLKWEQKVPPVELAPPKDILKYAKLAMANEKLWSLFVDHVGKWLPAEANLEMHKLARTFEKETGIYISPEGISDAYRLLQSAASKDINKNDEAAMLAYLTKHRCEL